MKNILLQTILLLTLFSTACAQQPNAEVYQKMYESATNYGDWSTATVALHGLLALDGEQELGSWKDSLAYVYLNMNGYGASEKLCSEILADQPDNVGIREVRAVSRRNLGLVKGAMADYETLLLETSNPFCAYYLAELQMGQDSLAQALKTLQIAERLDVKETDWVQLPVTKTQYQAVPLRAAVYHIKGLVLQNLNTAENKEHALAAYDKAIELFPDFYLAKNNRQVLAGQ
ncbi:MAG: hypothetical protein ACRBG0_22560 [Lewinella sp.]|uniref:hypothetical protein n=1 Tax=Lewinella sp. TaxID=2004506 RepID=UPI003D6A6801